MRGVRLGRFGGPSAVEIVNLPEPKPDFHEVLLRVTRCGLNRADVNYSYGQYGGVPRSSAPFGASAGIFPAAMGVQPVGVITAVGDGCDAALIGRRVMVVPRFGCGTCIQCQRGNENLCPDLRTLGTGTPDRGGLDEFLCVPSVNVVCLPDSITDEVGAAIAADFAPAWWVCRDLAKMEPGMAVAVKGASGNVGLAVLGIARLVGARAIAITRNDSKSAELLAAGASEIIQADPTRSVTQIRNILPGGADIVVEPFGGESWPDSIRALRNGGALAIVGSFVGAESRTDLRQIFHHSLRIVGGAHSPMSVIHRLVELIAAGRLSPVVGAQLPLSQIRRALELQESSAVVGKIVVNVDE